MKLPLPRLRPTVLVLCTALLWPPAWPQHQPLPALGEDTSMTLAAERRLGDRIARELYRDPDYLEDPVLDEFVLQLWTPLIDAAARRGELSSELRERFAWRVLLGRDRSVNAFALPGGYLGVHLGLIASVSTRDELASVLAHELSHVTQRHIARSMEAQGRMTPVVIGSLILGALAASKNPQGTQALITGGMAASMQSQLSYSRDMEREADRVGYGVLSEAGYDPRGFVTMFAKLQQAAGVNDNGAYPYLRTHPLTTERMADMQSRLPLGVNASAVPEDSQQAMMSARARVLSQAQVDALRVWTRLPEGLGPQSGLAQKAGVLYASALAHGLLREWPQAQRQLDRLRALSPEAAHQRLCRLLEAELLIQRGEPAQAVQKLQMPSAAVRWPRPELMAMASALQQLPGHPAHPVVLGQLRLLVQTTPHDAQAWQLMAALLMMQGQRVSALRAEGEAQWVRMDPQGALDRWRAAQEAARGGPLQSGEHIEASIVDSRLRMARELLREWQTER